MDKNDEQFDSKEELEKLEREAEKLLDTIGESEPKTVEEMCLEIVKLAEEGFRLTYREDGGELFNYNNPETEKLNILFSDILNLCSMSLMPMISDIQNLPKL